jgi:hypothetical protein
VDLREHFEDFLCKTIPFNLRFDAIVSLAHSDFLLLEIFLAELKSNWNTSELPMIVLESWVIIFTVIKFNSDLGSLELLAKFLGFAKES